MANVEYKNPNERMQASSIKKATVAKSILSISTSKPLIKPISIVNAITAIDKAKNLPTLYLIGELFEFKKANEIPNNKKK